MGKGSCTRAPESKPMTKTELMGVRRLYRGPETCNPSLRVAYASPVTKTLLPRIWLKVRLTILSRLERDLVSCCARKHTISRLLVFLTSKCLEGSYPVLSACRHCDGWVLRHVVNDCCRKPRQVLPIIKPLGLGAKNFLFNVRSFQ